MAAGRRWESWRENGFVYMWRRTYRSAVYALVVEKSFLQGDFLQSDLVTCHILSADKLSQLIWWHPSAFDVAILWRRGLCMLGVFTLMSSGRFTSSLFSCSFFSIDSRVLSTGGFCAFSCWDFLSSCEPKLLGSVLLRWRVTGRRSSSGFMSFCSGESSSS